MNSIDVKRLNEMLRYEDGKLFWKVSRSSFVPAGREAGHKKSDGYITLQIDGKGYSAHRMVWALYHGYWPTFLLDHINGVRDDNRIENLREVTWSENSWNRKRSASSTSGYKGVNFHKATKKFRSQIDVGGTRKCLGYFRTAEEAHEAYKAASAQYHGEFGNAG